MIDLTPPQKKTVAAGLTVLAFSVLVMFVLAVGWVFVQFLSFASAAITPVIVGLFLSLLFKPYYEWIRARCRNSTLSIFVTLVSILLPLGALLWFGGLFAIQLAMNLADRAPSIITRASAWVNAHFPADWPNVLPKFGVDPEGAVMFFFQADELSRSLSPEAFEDQCTKVLSGQYGDVAMKAGMDMLKYVTGLLSWLVSLIFFIFFLVRPSMKGQDYVRELPFLKDPTKEFVAKQIDAFTDILVNFFRRQVAICLVEGVLYGLGFMVVGLVSGFMPGMLFFFGFLLGVLNLVPFLGTVLCLPVVLLITYFGGGDGGSLYCFIGVLSVWMAGQFLDGYLITPKIQGDKTGLGYAGVIFSFFFWGLVFQSMLGLLLAIPLSAFCVVLWRALKERYIKGVI